MKLYKLLCLLFAFTLVAAACGSDGDDVHQSRWVDWFAGQGVAQHDVWCCGYAESEIDGG